MKGNWLADGEEFRANWGWAFTDGGGGGEYAGNLARDQTDVDVDT